MDLQMLDKLLVDERFMKLCGNNDKVKMFEIIGQRRREEWHSIIVGWLLNPNGSHLLKEFPMQRFLSLYYSKQNTVKNATRLKYTDIFEIDYDRMQCSFERKIKKEKW